ncbi:hypothetical protein F5Y06DRAFT_297950 [Hypoxylon sp. FL0890]|nr:hypothetical protein F5Y06DRAFT_297950 [Hypoxylon sp. FL0890]
MSDHNTTIATKDKGNPLDGLATETIIPIFCKLPNVKSILAFGAISKKYHAILSKHEGIIARNHATKILGDDDPGVVKLAFIACYARFIIRRTTEGLQQFLEAYVHRDNWPSQFYRLRAFSVMPRMNMGIELVEDWLATYGMLWPVKSVFKGFTPTESSRVRRGLYMLEAAVTIFEPTRGQIPEDELQELAERYWETFSRFEVDAGWDVLWKLAPSHLNCSQWSTCIRRCQGDAREYMPKPPYVELRQALNFVRINDAGFPHWRHVSPIFTALKKSHKGEREAGCTQFTEPFVHDPSAFYTKEVADSELFKHNLGALETYYNHTAVRWNILERYYFMIGDKDRCEQIIRERGMWKWGSQAQTVLSEMSFWHDDPASLGYGGCVATWM